MLSLNSRRIVFILCYLTDFGLWLLKIFLFIDTKSTMKDLGLVSNRVSNCINIPHANANYII